MRNYDERRRADRGEVGEEGAHIAAARSAVRRFA
jgi:hypothetical protein